MVSFAERARIERFKLSSGQRVEDTRSVWVTETHDILDGAHNHLVPWLP